MRPASRLAILASLSALLSACGPNVVNEELDGTPPNYPDGAPACVAVGDDDMDTIRNEVEGCLETPPRDTDGDGTPDYQDTDSDNDGVNDRFEDRNGDGLLGSCTTTCQDAGQCQPGEACSTPDTGGLGVCVSWECLDGETNPRARDTDGDGTPDGMEGTWVCNPRSEQNPNGLKPFKYVDSVTAVPYSTPNWRISLEEFAVDRLVQIQTPTALESVYQFDLTDPTIEVAGFLVTRPPTAAEGDVVSTSELAVQSIDGVAGVSSVLQRASGTRNVSLDGEDTILGTTLIVNTTSTDVTALRREIVAALLGKPTSALTYPNMGWTGAPEREFALVFQTLYREAPSGGSAQVLIMGGIASRADFEDPSRETGFHVDDLANGTGLTFSGNGDTIECEQYVVAETPVADIVWIVDESGSMSEHRDNVATNATSFFNKALAAGLDFRMGVTDMNDSTAGVFASRDAGSSTGDQWVLPTQISVFENNIRDPSGPASSDGGSEHGLTQARATLVRHLPRNDADEAKVREDSKLVFIFVTDEHPDEIEDAGLIADNDVEASAAQLGDIADFVQPYIQDFIDSDATVHLIGVPEPYPSCSSIGEVAYGYLDIISAPGIGGQFGSVCQPDLGATIDAIIDDIVGEASPIRLEWVPISLTIAVSRDGQPVPRSRTRGWDFRASSNSIVFYNMPFDPATPSEVVVSYRRWAEQVPIN